MIPVQFSGCVGWLHPAPGRRGVVLCGTVGNESLNLHRPWLMLAERLAAAGLPALRFDYPGTGDAAGDEDDKERLRTLLDSIAAAIAWMRRECGVEEVALCGFRFGAALATLAAAEDGGIESLALLAPVVSGKAWLREMTVAAKMYWSTWLVTQEADDGTWFEAAGVRFPSAARKAIEAVDLRKLPRAPAPRALLAEPEPAPSGLAAFAERLAALGTGVTRCDFAGYDALLLETHDNEVPEAVFDSTVAFLAAGGGPAPRAKTASVAQAPGLELDDVAEQRVRFGEGGQLVGVLCGPASGPPAVPPVLIVNTGCNPHPGNSRLAVTLARHLAGMGVQSLRMDGAGIGDSDPVTGLRGQPYAMAEIPAATAAIDFLCRGQDAGVIVLGLCSGAYLGFHTALADKRVRGLALVNQQKYVWVEGTPLSVVQRNTLRNTSFYVQGLKQAHVWRRLLRGEIHVRRIAPVLAGRVLRRLLAMAEARLGDLLPLQTETGRVRRWFQALYRRNVRVQIVLSPNDPGIDELEQYFGAGFARLRRFPNVSMVRLSNADHTLSTAAARQGFTEAFTDWLRRSFGLGRTDAVAGALLGLPPGALRRDDAGEEHPPGHPASDQAVPMPGRPRVMRFRPMGRPWADPAGSRS